MTPIPRQRGSGRAASALVFIGLTAASWTQVDAQPPQPPNENEAKRPRTTIKRRMRVIRNQDGEMVMETLDENGNVIERREVGTPPRLPRPPTLHPLAGDQGTLAVNEKYVFVLLNGVLYQYDADTLKLRNKAEVTPPAMGEGGGLNIQLWHEEGETPNAARARVVEAYIVTTRLGVALGEVTEGVAAKHGLEKPTGALVRKVTRGGSADRGGLKAGDLILRLNGKAVAGPGELAKAVEGLDAGETATIEILRDREKQTLEVKLAKAARTTQHTVTRVETIVTEPDGDQPRVTLDLQNANLPDVLRLLAKQTKAKITVGKGVTGKVTASLRDMPLDKALDSILPPHGMTWRRTDDGTFVVEAKGKGK